MRVVVAGATGFLGSAVIEVFHKQNIPVLGIARTERRGVISADLSRAGPWQKAIADFAPTHVFHIAGSTAGDDVSLERSNVLTTRFLVDAIKSQRPWLLSAGSGSVYGDVEKERLPVTEDCPENPIGAYAYSKFAQEQEARRHAGPLCLIRLANLLGPTQTSRFMVGRLVNEVCNIYQNTNTPSVIQMGSLDATRDFLDVQDAAAAIRSLAWAGAMGIYNVGSGRETPLREVVAMIKTICGGNWRVVEESNGIVSSIRRQVLAIDKIRCATGWQPSHDLMKTIQSMVDARRSEY